jgi:MFS family permease
MSHIVGAFLAVGILQLRGVNGQAGWRYLFLIEGGFTCLVGLFSFIAMPPGPCQTRSRFFPNGWFSERRVLVQAFLAKRKLILVRSERRSSWSTGTLFYLLVKPATSAHMSHRVLRDDPTKSSMHNREGLSLRSIFIGLSDWSMWPLYILGLVHFSECFLRIRVVHILTGRHSS